MSQQCHVRKNFDFFRVHLRKSSDKKWHFWDDDIFNVPLLIVSQLSLSCSFIEYKSVKMLRIAKACCIRVRTPDIASIKCTSRYCLYGRLLKNAVKHKTRDIENKNCWSKKRENCIVYIKAWIIISKLE
jgi:hypothetical protein